MRNLYEQLDELDSKLKQNKNLLGVGNFYNSLELLRQSYKEALASLGLISQDSYGCYEYRNLGIFDSIIKFSDDQIFLKSCNDILRPLIEYDSINGTNYFLFLKAFLYNNSNVSKNQQRFLYS